MRTLCPLFVLVLAAPTFAQGYGDTSYGSGGYAAPASDPFAGEPSIDEAIEAATRRFRVRVEDMNRYRGRAAASGLLPEAGVSVRTSDSALDVNRFDNLQFPGDQAATIDDATSDVFEIEVSAQWDLSEVVFNPLVLDVQSMVDD